MSNVTVTEREIEVAEEPRERGVFTTSLALTQDLLKRAHDDATRMRLLFDVLYCSSRLELEDITTSAIGELDKLPDPEVSRVFVGLIRVGSYIALGKNQTALDLIDTNLRSPFLVQENFRIWKYEYLAYRGRALVFLARPEESLASLQEAHQMYPEGKGETDILIDQANCLMASKDYEEAYMKASQVLAREDGEMATLALHYMADCRMLQRRVQDALKLYVDVQRRLPCRLVNGERVQRGISNCIAYLESTNPSAKTF